MMKEIVIFKKAHGNITPIKNVDGFFLPYAILKAFAERKGGSIIGRNGVFGAGCDVSTKNGPIIIKNLRRDDLDLVEAVRGEVRSDDISYQLDGISFKIVRIPDDVSWQIIGTNSKDEMVIWSIDNEGLDDAFVHQHPNEHEHFHLPLETLEKYVDQNHETRIVYSLATKTTPKQHTQFLNIAGTLFPTKDLGRKNPKLIRAIMATNSSLKPHLVIKKVWRKPVKHLKLTSSGSFEIILPEIANE